MDIVRRGAGMLTDFVDVVKQVPGDEIAAEAQRPLRIVVAGPPGSGKSTLIGRLVGSGGRDLAEPFAARHLLELATPLSGEALQAALDSDLAIWLADASAPPADVPPRELLDTGPPLLLALNKADLAPGVLDQARPDQAIALSAESSESVRETLLPAVLDAAPHLSLALGRTFSAFRPVVAECEIQRVARVNAEVAIVSAIPQASLILGPASAVADSLILTKNQAVLLLRLAVMFGLPVDRSRVGELLAVAGAGLGWRTLARELVGFVPGGLGVVPKAVIAYAGTVAAGRAGLWYYQTGRSMPQRQLSLLRRASIYDARQRVRDLVRRKHS